MATVTHSFPKILKMLRENSNTKEKREALTYIRSNTKKLESSSTIKEEQYKDLCKLIIEASTSKDHNVQHEAYDTLKCIVEDFRSHKLNLFKSMQQINRKDRLKVLKLLDIVDDVAISIAANDTSIIDLLNDCMCTVKSGTMDWILPTACTDNLQKLTEAENSILSDDQKLEEEMINYSLNLLRRLYKVALNTADNKIRRFDALLMEKVVLLAYMGHKRQRGPALKVIQQAVLTNLATYVRTDLPDIWRDYKNALQSAYCKRMQLLVTDCDLDWAVQWNISVQLLGTDLHRGASLINNLLSVEEKAFKSADAVIRRQAFLSWKLLIDNFALDHQELATTRRIKLLCIPLNAKNSKTELIALTKLEVWWHLIVKLYKDIGKFVDPVITQFLNFCFGPLGETPLLSSKCDVVASPGKRFFKTKLVAVDTLCQLLVPKQENHMLHPSILEEVLPHCICGSIFEDCYKSIIHSVGEALLILSQLNDKEMKNRCQVGKLLWSNLVNYAQESKEEIKDLIYKDILLVINELTNHIADKPMIKDLIFDVIVFEIPNFNKDIQIHSTMLSDLFYKLLSPPVVQEIKTNHCKGVNCLLWECIKPKIGNEYRTDTLEFLKTVLDKIVQVEVENKSITVIPEIWCIVAEILTKYMEDSGNVNEGNAANHNFKIAEYILKFPFVHIFLKDLNEIQQIGGVWKKLYKQFDLQADLIVTVKVNEVLLNTIKMMQCCLNKNKDCSRLAITCLEALLNSINYNSLLAHSEIPSIVEFLMDLIRIAFNNTQLTDCDTTLRALSAILITVYGHNSKKAILYLQYVKPVIELVLTSPAGTLLKDVTSIWETVLSIFKGLGKNHSLEILSLYKQLIIQAVNHYNLEITMHTLSFLDEASNFDEEALSIVEEIRKKIKPDKLPFKSNNVEKKMESTKQVKIAGSFLNRKCASPKTILSGAQKENDGKRISSPDPESQEYVYIKTDVKYDVNRLTEHQKEVLKKKRDDIPALYNDLSQSSSQSSQHLQEWFDKRVNRINEADYTHDSRKNDSSKEESIDHDANKENTIDSTEYSITDGVSTDLRSIHSTNLFNEESKSNRQGNTSENSKEEIETTSKILTSEALSPSSEEETHEDSDTVAKRLNFESRDEFPGDKDFEEQLSPSLLESGKRRNRNNTVKASNNEVNPEKTINAQTEQNKSKLVRTSRTKLSLTKPGVNNNDKDVDKKDDKLLDDKRKGTKRKYTSDSDIEDDTHHKRWRKELASTSETVSDSESSRTDCTREEQLPLSRRTKTEMSRLKINMVFYSPLPKRRRSQQPDESQDPNSKQQCEKDKRQKATNSKISETRKLVKIESKEEPRLVVNQSLIKKKYKKRVKKPDEDSSEKILEKETKSETDDSTSDEANTSAPSETVDNVNPDLLDNNKTRDNKKKVKEHDESVKNDCNEEQRLSEDDGTQEIENSQDPRLEGINDKQCFIKIDKIDKIVNVPIVKTYDNKDNSTGSVKKSIRELPTKILEADAKIEDKIGDKIDDKTDDRVDDKIEEKIDVKVDDKIEDKIDEATRAEDNAVNTGTVNESGGPGQREDEKKSSASDLSTNNSPTRKMTPVTISSPKTVKRYTKIKSYSPQGGRAAHMLGLVTKQALVESNNQNVKPDEDSMSKRMKSKEGESELKKDKSSMMFKDNEKMSSGPSCSSRQEKIFNNMKSGEYVSSSPVKSFSNLKNDGEKTSTNVDKAIPNYMLISLENTFEKGTDGSLSPSQEKTELPMLEWSSANPPSLTASPSASILKRHRMSLPECDTEAATPNKRKRVSFADPPVSKQMGYEITLTESPHKANKLSMRAMMIRKDSPSRMKQTKLKFIQMDPEKLDKDIEGQLDQGCEIDLQCERENALLTKMAEELEYSENMVIDVDSPTGCAFPENANEIVETNPCAVVTINNLSQEIEITGEDSAIKKSHYVINEDKDQSQEFETQQDMFGSQEFKADIDQSAKNDEEESIDRNDSAESSQTLSIENLEDTVDVENITNFNSTANSDEIFCAKPLRTSTQTTDNIAEQDTLPVTDSIFGSQPFSQTSECSNETPYPELLNDSEPVCPDLISCKKSLDSVINHLTNPLWIKNLATYFSSRNISTIGDLAQLTEREINRIPVRGNPKVDYVRKVLRCCSSVDLLEMRSYPETSTDDTKTLGPSLTYANFIGSCPVTSEETCENDETVESPSVIEATDDMTEGNDVPKTACDVSCQTEAADTKNACTMTISTCNASSQTPITYVDSSGEVDLSDEVTRYTRSIGVCTDPVLFPKPVKKLTKSVAAQMALEDLLDEIDVNLVMQSAVRRSSSESILAQYKMKTRSLPEAEVEKETLKVLCLENKASYYEAKLKSACRACGVNKVLLRLPDIFNAETQFFNKVLSAYHKKITISDCMSVFNFKEIKDFICQKCTSSEIAELLSITLKEEEKRGIKTPMTELSCFSGMLKRVPMDVIISHTVANEELIPPQLVLDIALQNSSSTDITRTLEVQSTKLMKDVFDKLWSPELVLSHIESKCERAELLELYKAISSKLSPKELLDAYNVSMNAKLSNDGQEQPSTEQPK